MIQTGKFLLVSVVDLNPKKPPYSNAGLYLSSDSGATWQRGINDGQYFWFKKIGDDLYGGHTRKLLRHSSDNGNSWKNITYNIDGNTAGIVRYGSNLYTVMALEGIILRLADNDTTWETMSPYLRVVWSFDIQGNKLFGADDLLIIASLDSSTVDWQTIPIADLDAITTTDKFIFAGGKDTCCGQVYYSFNQGLTWKNFTNDLKCGNIDLLRVNNGYLFASSGTLWRRPLSDLSVPFSNTNYRELGLSLSPNPTSGMGNISFTLHKSSQMRIEIYNAIGQRLQPLPINSNLKEIIQ